MLRATLRVVVLAVLFAAGSVAVWYVSRPDPAALQIKKLEEEKRQLQQIVQRLTDEKRIAEVIVTDQKMVNGVPETTVLFVEQSRERDGTPLPPKSFTVRGRQVYVAGLSIRFNEDFLVQNDPLRGHGIFLFERIFGDAEKPSEGAVIDAPGKVPDVYRGDPGVGPRVSEFEADLWKNFWRLVDDRAYREEKGVALASGKAVYTAFEPGKLYRITLDARGNPSIDWEPIRPIYKEALRKAGTTSPAQ